MTKHGSDLRWSIVMLLIAAVVVPACGSSPAQSSGNSTPTPSAAPPVRLQYTNTDAAGQPEGSIKVVMKDVQFIPKTLTAKAGKITFYLVNQEPTNPDECKVLDCGHNMILMDSKGNSVAYSDKLKPGQTKVFTIEAVPAGKYTFYCNVGAHEANWHQNGTLEVT